MKKLPAALCACVITALMAWAVGAAAQVQSGKGQPPTVERMVSDHIYDAVLDIVFPREGLESAYGYAFVLRYKPSFGPESQLNIVSDGGGIEITEYAPSGGSVLSQLSRSPRFTDATTAAEAAKLVKVTRRTWPVSTAEGKRLRAEFFDHLRDASDYETANITEDRKKISVTTDGTDYILWYRGVGTLSFNSAGSNVEDVPRFNEHPLVKWMKGVHRAASGGSARVRRN